MTAGRKALLVAAGIGSRLRPLTDVVPKCLIPINGRPLLGLWLEMLQEAGFDEVVVNLHHHADLVREYVWRSPYARLVTLVHEPELLGTGGTLLANKDPLPRGPNPFRPRRKPDALRSLAVSCGACGAAAGSRAHHDDLPHRYAERLWHRRTRPAGNGRRILREVVESA